MKYSALLREGQKVSEVAKACRGVSRNHLRDQEAYGRYIVKVSTDVQAVVERLFGMVTACGIPFEGQGEIFRYLVKGDSFQTCLRLADVVPVPK